MIKWSTDRSIAQRVITDPAIWPWVSDDTCDLDTFEFPEIDGVKIRMALCYNGLKFCGCFLLYEQSEKLTEIHTCLLVHGMAKIFGDQVVSRIFSDTDYESIQTFIPVDNPPARKLAIKCGFNFIENRNPIIKNGINTPVEVWRLDKCQQQFQ